MLLWCKKSFVVSPPFNERETTSFPSCMSQSVHDILKYNTNVLSIGVKNNNDHFRFASKQREKNVFCFFIDITISDHLVFGDFQVREKRKKLCMAVYYTTTEKSQFIFC